MSDIVTASEMRWAINCKHNLFHMVVLPVRQANWTWSDRSYQMVWHIIRSYTMISSDWSSHMVWHITVTTPSYFFVSALEQFPNPTLLRCFMKTRNCTVPIFWYLKITSKNHLWRNNSWMFCWEETTYVRFFLQCAGFSLIKIQKSVPNAPIVIKRLKYLFRAVIPSVLACLTLFSPRPQQCFQ